MNPNLNALLTAVRTLLLVVGGIMAKEGFEHSTIYSVVMILSGSIMVLGPAVWGVWSSFSNWRKASAVGVAAGINMTIRGKALAEDGTTVVSAFDGATPPKPVTIATAAEIVKDFAPPTASIAKS